MRDRSLRRRRRGPRCCSPKDLAQTFLLVATLPHRATIELLTIYPTVQRDWTAEVRSA